MEISQEFQIGLISGFFSSVFATIFIGFFILIFKEILLPRIRALFYQGIILEGEWNAKGERDEYFWEAIMNVKQNGANLKGDILLKNDIKGEDRDTFFNLKFKGVVKDSRVLLNYEAKSRKNVNMGTLLLRIADSGQTLQGAVLYISDREKGIGVTNEIEYKRK